MSAQPQDAPRVVGAGLGKADGKPGVMTFPQSKDEKPILVLVEVKMPENWSCAYPSVPPVCPQTAALAPALVPRGLGLGHHVTSDCHPGFNLPPTCFNQKSTNSEGGGAPGEALQWAGSTQHPHRAVPQENLPCSALSFLPRAKIQGRR